MGCFEAGTWTCYIRSRDSRIHHNGLSSPKADASHRCLGSTIT